jgi:hypothetical protein
MIFVDKNPSCCKLALAEIGLKAALWICLLIWFFKGLDWDE